MHVDVMSKKGPRGGKTIAGKMHRTKDHEKRMRKDMRPY